MTVSLNNLTFETGEGTWRTVYIGDPHENGDRVEYHIRFKWVDPHDAENKATPERRLRLLTYDQQTINSDYADKLKRTLHHWIDSTDEADAVFDYDQAILQQRDRS